MDAGISRGIRGNGLRELYEAAEAKGCRLSLTGKKRVRVDTPSGPVFGPQTAGDWRAAKNLRAMLRRKGIKL